MTKGCGDHITWKQYNQCTVTQFELVHLVSST